MAEIVTISAVLLSTVSVANNVYKLVRAMREVDDPRVKMLQYRILTQREMAVAWANRIWSAGSESWNIPPESARDVEQILREMQSYFRRAEEKMEKIYRASDGRTTSRIFLQRFWFSNGGFQEIHDLTEALDTMNRALLLIAPPPPHHMGHEKYPRGADDKRDSARHVSTAETPRSKSNLPEGVEAVQLKVPISTLHGHCVEALNVLGDFSTRGDMLKHSLDHLKRWGSGILAGGPLSLDAVFEGHHEKTKGLETIITRTLVYIAVIEEIFLRQLCDEDTSNQRRLHRQHTQILATLGIDQFNGYALESWTNMMARKWDQGSTMEQPLDTELSRLVAESWDRERVVGSHGSCEPTAVAKPSKRLKELEDIEEETEALEQVLTTRMARDPPSEDNLDSPAIPSMSFDQTQILHLYYCIELLFSLLPAIRRLRRQHVLEIEALERPGKDDRAPVNTVTHHIDEPNVTGSQKAISMDSLGFSMDHLLNHSLQLASSLETILRNDESWAKKNNQKVQAHATVLQREVDRLITFKRAVSANESLSEAEKRQVVTTVSTLSEALHQAIKNVSVSEQPSSEEKDRFRLVDAIPENDVDEVIKRVIDQFAASNTKMWLQSAKLQPQVKMMKA